MSYFIYRYTGLISNLLDPRLIDLCNIDPRWSLVHMTCKTVLHNFKTLKGHFILRHTFMVTLCFRF